MQCFLSTTGHLKFNALMTLHIFTYLNMVWSIHDIGHSHTNSWIFIGYTTGDQYNDVSFSLLWTPICFYVSRAVTFVCLTMTIILLKKDKARIALNSKRLCYSLFFSLISLFAHIITWSSTSLLVPWNTQDVGWELPHISLSWNGILMKEAVKFTLSKYLNFLADSCSSQSICGM